MADSQEMTISDIRGSVTKSGPDVYVEFRLGERTATTGVVKHAEEKIEFTEPVTIAANEGGRGSQAESADELVVRAYDKHSLLPDTLLGRATVALSGLQLGDASVAGSGGGANVQVQLLGKKGVFGGALEFTITGTEGLSGVPGGPEFGPQEVAGGNASGPTAAESPTTGVPGAGGATAFPAAAAGRSLGGEHLSDYQQGSTGQTDATGRTGMLHKGDEELAAAAAVPAAAAAAAAAGGHHGSSEPQQQPQQDSYGAVSPTIGVPGEGGATAFPAAASGRDLGGEHLSDFQQGGSAGHTGMLHKGSAAAVAAPAAGVAAGAPEATGMQGQQEQMGGGGDNLVLTVSDIGAKFTREDDIIGLVTPYLVFEVDGERETTSKLGGIRAMEQQTWPETLELDLGSRAPSELHVLAYNKKLLPVPDGVLGEVRAPLDQLPRGRQIRLVLKDTKAIGNLAGEVTFTLTGGGPGGSGAGDEPPLADDVRGLSLADNKAVATGEQPGHSERQAAAKEAGHETNSEGAPTHTVAL